MRTKYPLLPLKTWAKLAQVTGNMRIEDGGPWDLMYPTFGPDELLNPFEEVDVLIGIDARDPANFRTFEDKTPRGGDSIKAIKNVGTLGGWWVDHEGVLKEGDVTWRRGVVSFHEPRRLRLEPAQPLAEPVSLIIFDRPDPEKFGPSLFLGDQHQLDLLKGITIRKKELIIAPDIYEEEWGRTPVYAPRALTINGEHYDANTYSGLMHSSYRSSTVDITTDFTSSPVTTIDLKGERDSRLRFLVVGNDPQI